MSQISVAGRSTRSVSRTAVVVGLRRNHSAATGDRSKGETKAFFAVQGFEIGEIARDLWQVDRRDVTNVGEQGEEVFCLAAT
jgi:hypothetical protein